MAEIAAAAGYSTSARVLHWLTAALVIVMIPIGIAMANADFGSAQDTLYHLHRSTGILVIILVLARLAVRFRNPPPPLPADIPAIQQLAAHLTHWALYILLLVQGFVGWIATSAYRAPIIFFGMFEVPPIWPVNQPFSETMFGVHKLLGIALVVLICMHVGAALFHHFVRKDQVLMRMVRG